MKSDYQLRHIRPSFCLSVCVRMEQLGSHWIGSDKTWYLSF
jgi:hypothetical protein